MLKMNRRGLYDYRVTGHIIQTTVLKPAEMGPANATEIAYMKLYTKGCTSRSNKLSMKKNNKSQQLVNEWKLRWTGGSVVPTKTTECRSGSYPQTHGQRAAIIGNYTQQRRATTHN